MITRLKKSIVLILFFKICTIAYTQQVVKPDTSPNDSINKKSITDYYEGILETGYCWGLGEWGQSVFRFNFINSARFGHYAVGIGSGFSILNKNQNQKGTIRFKYQVPVYIDNRIYFFKPKIQGYFSCGIGISFVAFDMLADLSLFINSSTGVAWKVSDKVSLIFGIYCESYNIKYKREDPPERSITLGPAFGISF